MSSRPDPTASWSICRAAPIYYSIHSNATFGDFIKQNGLLDPAKLRAFDPNTSFPVNTLTLKAAWKVVAPGEDVSTFYTRAAQVALLTMKSGKIVLSRKTRPVRVALVGFHIAAAVNGHPEMIWATFEHVRNTPDLPKPVDQMGPDEVVSDKAWTFYEANTRFRDCNVNSAGAGALKLNERRQTLSPVNAGLPHHSLRRRQREQCRQHQVDERLRCTPSSRACSTTISRSARSGSTRPTG